MANPKLRLAENADGEFFVDSTCIDCDTCRQLAPATFRDHGAQSSVFRQPRTAEEKRRAQMAIVACPTGSIGSADKRDVKSAIGEFPFQITENIYYCGFNSEKSFGAWSYLIVRPRGNVLVDSPRFSAPLVKKIEALGGVSVMFLSHRDDIADHARFAEKFGARRVMHADDGAARRGIEKVIEGVEAVEIDDELTVVPQSGHTRGSQVLLYKNRFLFSGDHLAWSPERETLTAFRGACWFSWSEQIRSMQRLARYDFEWVLPGHGRIANRPKAEMRRHLAGCIEWMQTK
ncbi:MAG TPA: MBL fold metallo-hydrolase [Pyrinomonadaceae bacterium]|jgi:glyoxylase-like metal-dependent hydrolase (beta-lactamase superfamily II)/ferredoxin